ncbi:DUF3341 domain-containing protein [Gimesia sp.]|uniref:DUF3341 domain-containing protein n=1 Tax=Gimesia sp. TaxID=2024833 RepID=UPI000C613322|nr:DUF3341 domain-containing protein [Gimesia sp.]MAX34973.1 hypothetical protein [Gimesia sp.]HAH43534.1 DUF3341 domain-containing protein [Planctomycetaceae bacterium]HBL45306.1 DUF3341 domain-containing protein [Planctomycetaceae bacterium]
MIPPDPRLSSTAAASEAHESGPLFGLLAQFSSDTELIEATHTLYADGYRALDAFSPFPLEDLSDALHLRRSLVAPIVLGGGILGGISIYALEYWVNLFAYPLNVGGRPLHSWVSFIPPAFECIILLGALAGAGGMLLLCGLPRLNHPVFEVEAFRRASTDAWFLCVQSEDAQFDSEMTRQSLLNAGAQEVWDVPAIEA